MWPVLDRVQSKEFNQVCARGASVTERHRPAHTTAQHDSACGQLRSVFTQRVSDWFKELRERYALEALSSMTASQLKSASGHR